jgi:hypothetical protein
MLFTPQASHVVQTAGSGTGGDPTTSLTQGVTAACKAGTAVAIGNIDGDPHGDPSWSLPGKTLAGLPGEGVVIVRTGRW